MQTILVKFSVYFDICRDLDRKLGDFFVLQLTSLYTSPIHYIPSLTCFSFPSYNVDFNFLTRARSSSIHRAVDKGKKSQ